MRRVGPFLVLLALLGASPARGQSKTGTTFGAFLLIEPSARIAAMGNAGAGAPEGLDAVYYNPAAIARLGGYGIQFSHAEWVADIAYNYVAASAPLGRFGNAFGSVTALGSGDIDVRTVSQPLGTGELFSVTDVAFTLGYGRQITDRFSMGLQAAYVQETIWHTSAGTAVLGFGTLYQVSDRGLRLGASLSNFGTQARFSGRDLRTTFDQDPSRNGDNGTLPAQQVTDPFSVPVLFRVGIGMPFRFGADHELRVSVDALHPADNAESVNAGAEWVYRKSVALRLGYQDAFLSNSEVGFTMGAGVGMDAGGHHYLFDYGWADFGRLGSVHRLSLALKL